MRRLNNPIRFIFIILLSTGCKKDSSSGYERHEYISIENDTIPYRLLIPENYNVNLAYPLVIALSGAGGRGVDNQRQLQKSWISKELTLEQNREAHPCFVFVPQCPPDKNFGHALTLNQKAQLTDINEPGIDSLLFVIIEELVSNFNIDQKRLYVFGESMGAIGGWGLITQKQDLFAAAILVSGGAYYKHGSDLAQFPIWALHGKEDKIVPNYLTKEIILEMEKNGGSPIYSEVEDIGHNLPVILDSTSGLIEWLFKQNNQDMLN